MVKCYWISKLISEQINVSVRSTKFAIAWDIVRHAFPPMKKETITQVKVPPLEFVGVSDMNCYAQVAAEQVPPPLTEQVHPARVV